MPTPRKRAMVRDLQDRFTGSEVLIFTDHRGLSVSEITNLRRQLRDKGVEYHVTKNTLTTLAADKAGRAEMTTLLDGPTAIAFVGDDIPGAAKVLTDFVRTSRILQIRGGLVGHTVISADQVSDLTKILTREQYIARVLGSMQSPISGMVGALSGVIRNFMNVMQARVDQLKEQGGEEEVVPETSASPNGAAPAAQLEETTPIASATTTAPAAPAAEATPEAPAEDATPVASAADTAPETPAEDTAPAASTEEPAAEDEPPAATEEGA